MDHASAKAARCTSGRSVGVAAGNVATVTCDMQQPCAGTAVLHPAPPKVQNAAIGDPGPLAELDLNHFEEAFDL